MRLMPPKEVNNLLNTERKNQIDSGVFIAKRIDFLREDLANITKERLDFIAGSQEAMNIALKDLHDKTDRLKKEVSDLEAQKAELQKPLDAQWEKVNALFKENTDEKEVLRLKKEELDQRETQITKDTEEISKITAKVRRQDEESVKANENARAIQEVIARKAEVVEEEHRIHTEAHEKLMAEAVGLRNRYENGLALYESKVKDLEAREQKLLSETAHLESQQAQLRNIRESLEK